MDLEKWTVLLRALDRGSLSAAAEELGYTPSGVSRAVASLEEELGVPLLARLHRGVAPTRECQALLPMAREMVHLSSLLAQRSDELRGLVSGSLSVGTAYHHYYPWLSRMIAGFTHRYPGVTINLLEGTSSELCQAVRERRADLCIASRREGPFRWTPIHEGPLVVLVPERHPLAEGDRVPIDALRTEPFIELNPGLETDNSRFFAKYDLHPNTRFTTSDPTAVRSIVSAGLGISLINDLQAGTEKNGIRIAMLNFTYGLNNSMPEKRWMVDMLSSTDTVCGRIAQAKQEADFVIVFPHWGTEDELSPDESQLRWAQEMADAGADLIIGGHPHTLQPTGLLTAADGRDVPVYYSLGNFLSHQKEKMNLLGGMASVTIVKDADGTHVSEYDLQPTVNVILRNANTGWYTYRPMLLDSYSSDLAAQNRFSECTIDAMWALYEDITG